jgi:outer membrane protein assembly factor BamB
VGDGNVYALDADSGKKIWNYTYTLPDASGVYIPSSPILEMGLST